MPQRIIIGPVVDAAGTGVASGELHITPVVPAGTMTDGFVIQPKVYPITEGDVSATVVVPGIYRLEIFDANGERRKTFNASISGESLAGISLKELWEGRNDHIEVTPTQMREGESILRLAPGGGESGETLLQVDGALVWGTDAGAMRVAAYDPQGKRRDVYDRAGHTGTQPISSVAGLSAALGFIEYATIADRKPLGTAGGTFDSGADRLRTLNTIVLNNSGLPDAALLDSGTSAITLLPGRIYTGVAKAQASNVQRHYLILKSTDGSIVIPGVMAVADTSGNVAYINTAEAEFHIEVPADAGEKYIQVYHRCQISQADFGMGEPMRIPGTGLPEEFARITIYSRPL